MTCLDNKGQVVFSTEEITNLSVEQLRGMSARMRNALVPPEVVVEQDILSIGGRATTLDGLEEADLRELRAMLANNSEEVA
jgi:hypothetical protein